MDSKIYIQRLFDLKFSFYMFMRYGKKILSKKCFFLNAYIAKILFWKNYDTLFSLHLMFSPKCTAVRFKIQLWSIMIGIANVFCSIHFALTSLHMTLLIICFDQFFHIKNSVFLKNEWDSQRGHVVNVHNIWRMIH